MASALIAKTQVTIDYLLTFALSCILLGLATLPQVRADECKLSVECLPKYLCINGVCTRTSNIWDLDDEYKRKYVGEILTMLVFIFLGLFAVLACAICIRNLVKSCSRQSDDTRSLLAASPRVDNSRTNRTRRNRPPRRPNTPVDTLPPTYQSTSSYSAIDDKNDPPPPYSQVAMTTP